jgi:hypothetical protein
MATYQKPGVYLEETLLNGPNVAGNSNAVTLFVGAAERGPTTDPVRIESWTDYVTYFGSFGNAGDAETGTKALKTFLPYAVYSFYQNGGRVAYVQRVLSDDATDAVASVEVTDGTDTAFIVEALSGGVWGNSLSFTLEAEASGVGSVDIYKLAVFKTEYEQTNLVEVFSNITVGGSSVVPGTKTFVEAINDSIYGSRLIKIANYDNTVIPDTVSSPEQLAGGTDGGTPTGAELQSAFSTAIPKITGPVVVNVVGHIDAGGDFVGAVIDPTGVTELQDRENVFIINDGVESRDGTVSASSYKATVIGALDSAVGRTSYAASYAPWIVVGDPSTGNGGTVTIPPGGAVAGIFARTDATQGVYKSPAGIQANITNAVGVDVVWSDTELGALNSTNHINVIRPLAGSGICVMGARTNKRFNADRYISARRTLIYLKESLRNSTEFAVFENNDERLWARLRATADRVLRPVWANGGLRGNTADDAYYIVCDNTVNTPAIIASGEVRMEIGVALEYPAEFVVIRISQFESGTA